MIRVGVVARGNEVAAARVLAGTLREHHPDWPLTVLVLPGLRPPLRGADEPFHTLMPSELGLLEVDRLLLLAPPALLSRYMQVALLARLLEEPDTDGVLLLAPDAEVHAPLDDLARRVDAHPAVTFPRVAGRLPGDGHRPDGRDLLEAGEVDDGLVAVAATAEGRALCGWWTERVREAIDEATPLRLLRSEHVPPRLAASPLGAATRVFGSIASVGDPGWNVSHWNLHERPLARRDSELTAAGEIVRVLRWPGFRADRPWWLSEGGTRVSVLDDPLLSELCGERARRLREAGWLSAAELAADRPELGNGLVFDERLRRLHAEASDVGEDFGDVFSPAGAEAFATWLREPAGRAGLAGVNRYAMHVWRDRPDVAAAYPDLDADSEGFRGWLWVHGVPELRLQAPLLPPAPGWVDQLTTRIPPVVVTGYLRGHLGLGVAARGYVDALRAGDVPLATRSVATDPPVDKSGASARRRPDERPFEELALPAGVEPEVELLCVNADQTPMLIAEAGGGGNRYRIGHWAWETDAIPERWDAAFDLVDELWVNSGYVAENIARAGNVPVVVIPSPVAAPDPAGAGPPAEVPDGFVFLFAFDFFSTLQRKNPLALVEAFKSAFSDGEGPLLVLKTINAGFRPEAHANLRWAIGGRSDILVLDRTLPEPEMAALFARADCYVSLHRSEGFGLTLAEAMALGKPVIATGFSGNTDFMTPHNSYLVDFEPTEVGPNAEHYPAEGMWAEPSVEHAAQLMREVWSDQEAAAARGERARRDVETTLSHQAVGALARARLERIAANRDRTQQTEALPWPLGEVERRLADAVPTTGPARGARSAARQVALRAIAPYIASERRLDEAVAGSLRRLHLELEAERAARVRDRLRIERLERRVRQLLGDPG